MPAAAASAAARATHDSHALTPPSGSTDERARLCGHEAGQTVAGDLWDSRSHVNRPAACAARPKGRLSSITAAAY